MSNKRASSVLEGEVEKAELCKLACVALTEEEEDEIKDEYEGWEFKDIPEGLPAVLVEARKFYNENLANHRAKLTELRELRAQQRRDRAEMARLDDVIKRLLAELEALN
jgi:hypothetical protein